MHETRCVGFEAEEVFWAKTYKQLRSPETDLHDRERFIFWKLLMIYDRTYSGKFSDLRFTTQMLLSMMQLSFILSASLFNLFTSIFLEA